MKTLDVKDITEAVRALSIACNVDLPADVEHALKQAQQVETSPFGQYCLSQIVDNAALARSEQQAMCQDTGITVVYLEVGQDLHLVGGDVTAAVHEGVCRGYDEGYLRKSIVEEPVFERKNTNDNTPAVIHMTLVPGTQLKITVMPKGGGAENMGALGMLKPTAGKQGVIDFVKETVSNAGGNPCPPIIVGVGIGGTMERATALAKESLMRDVGSHHADARYAALEEELLVEINKLGIGPQGLGGKVTALAVHINTAPTHIASMPVAVNINCHAARHKQVILEGREAE